MTATKRELTISNLKLQTENARQAKRIRNLQRQLDVAINIMARCKLLLNGEANTIGDNP